MADEIRISRELAQAAAQLIHIAIHPATTNAVVEQVRFGLLSAIAQQPAAPAPSNAE